MPAVAHYVSTCSPHTCPYRLCHVHATSKPRLKDLPSLAPMRPHGCPGEDGVRRVTGALLPGLAPHSPGHPLLPVPTSTKCSGLTLAGVSLCVHTHTHTHTHLSLLLSRARSVIPTTAGSFKSCLTPTQNTGTHDTHAAPHRLTLPRHQRLSPTHRRALVHTVVHSYHPTVTRDCTTTHTAFNTLHGWSHRGCPFIVMNSLSSSLHPAFQNDRARTHTHPLHV